MSKRLAPGPPTPDVRQLTLSELGRLMFSRGTPIAIEEPRSVGQIIGVSIALWLRYPLLFLGLALAVVVPYELVVLAVTGSLSVSGHGVVARAVIVGIELLLIGPLISALHVHAVVRLARGERPRPAQVAASGLRSLRFVLSAELIALIAIGMTLAAPSVLAIMLAITGQAGALAGLGIVLICALVAQSAIAVSAPIAALDRTGWIKPVSRSANLATDDLWHVAGLVFLTQAAVSAISQVAGRAAHTRPTAWLVLVVVFAETVRWSYVALTSSILLFDLRARRAWRSERRGSVPPA